MSLQTKVIGRTPTDHGPYNPNTSYGKKFCVTLFGCMWESLHDNNNTAPAVWDGGDTITPNLVDWKKVSGDYNAWLMNQNKPAQSVDYPFNGMGRVKLLKHVVDGHNLLYQDDFYKDGPNNTRVPNTNTVFEVPYEFELAEDITVPAGCVLDFHGGSISGDGTDKDTITFNGTTIISDKVAFDGCRFAGTLKKDIYYISTFGVKEGVNALYIINEILTCIEGNFSELVFDCDFDYILNDSYNPPVFSCVYIKDNTTVSFKGSGFLKCTSYLYPGTVVDAKGNNIRINNCRVDGNQIFAGSSGMNGISIIGDSISINGGIIKNCERGDNLMYNDSLTYGAGGKGIQAESHGITNCHISNVYIENCTVAISAHVSGLSIRPNTQEMDLHYSNIYAKNCRQFMYCMISNTNEIAPKYFNVSVDGFICEECGNYKLSDIDPLHPNDVHTSSEIGVDFIETLGILNLSRATNLHVENGLVLGSTTSNSFISGTHNNCTFKNICIYQPTSRLIDCEPTVMAKDHSTYIKFNEYIINHYAELDFIAYSYVKNIRLRQSILSINIYGNNTATVINGRALSDNSVIMDIKAVLPNEYHYFAGSGLTIFEKTIADIDSIISGTTRPQSIPVGYMFFDMTSGIEKPIYYKGKDAGNNDVWVDSTGATV